MVPRGKILIPVERIKNQLTYGARSMMVKVADRATHLLESALTIRFTG